MIFLGVNIAILDEGKVLLTRREDFDVWCMPGGSVDPGESLAHAAIREALEETGLQVELTRLVGIYSRPHYQADGSHIAVFAALPIGGILCPQASEVLEAGYYAPGELPSPLLLGQEQRLRDVFNNVGGSSVWVQDAPWPFPPEITRPEIYKQRDDSGLTRREFYQHYIAPLGLEDEHKDVW